MQQMKVALLDAVQKSGPIRTTAKTSFPPAFQIQADKLIRQSRAFKDTINFLTVQMNRADSAHGLAPYILAIHQLRPDMKIPRAPMFVEAVKMLNMRFNTITDSDPTAAISPGYDIVPASDAARKEQVKHNEKQGKTYQGNKTIRTRNPNCVGRFSFELGYPYPSK